MRSRLAKLFGSELYLVERIKIALGRKQTAAEDIVSGRKVPADVELIIELLEACPVHLWPEKLRRVCDGAPGSRGGGRGVNFSDVMKANAVLRRGGTNNEAAAAMGVGRNWLEELQRQGRIVRSRVPRGRRPGKRKFRRPGQ